MARAAAKKKGASRNTRASGQRRDVPGWVWLLLGLAIGVFAAFLWHLSELRKQGATRPATTAAATDSGGAARRSDKAAGSIQGKPQAGDESRFEFYTLLPSQEVMPDRSAPATPPPIPAAPAAEIRYVLQAGSFKSEAEADRRRAAILMLGMPVKVVKVPVKPGETWYRVVVGPFTGKAAAQEARANLRNNGVDTLVLKQG